MAMDEVITIPNGYKTIDKMGNTICLEVFCLDEKDLISMLKTMPRLEEVDLEYSVATDAVVAQLSKCKELKIVRIGKIEDSGRNKLTNKSLESLACCKNLECVTIRGLGINDRGVELLVGNQKIEQLDLTDCSISRKSHKVFKKFARLESLRLSTPGWTKKEFDSFTKQLPKVKVHSITPMREKH